MLCRRLALYGVSGRAVTMQTAAAKKGTASASLPAPYAKLHTGAAASARSPPGSAGAMNLRPATVGAQSAAKAHLSEVQQQQVEGQQQQSLHRRRRRRTSPVRHGSYNLLDGPMWSLPWERTGLLLEEWSCIQSAGQVVGHDGEPKQGGVTWFVVATSFEEVEMRNPVQPQDIKKRLQEGLQAAAAQQAAADCTTYKLHTAYWVHGQLWLSMSTETDTGAEADWKQVEESMKDALRHANLQEYTDDIMLRGVMHSQITIGQLEHVDIKVPQRSSRRRSVMKHGCNAPSVWWAIRYFAPDTSSCDDSVYFSLHLCDGDDLCELVARVEADYSRLPNLDSSEAVKLTDGVDILMLEVSTMYQGIGYGKAMLGVVERHVLDVFGSGSHVAAWNNTEAGQQLYASQGYEESIVDKCWFKYI